MRKLFLIGLLLLSTPLQAQVVINPSGGGGGGGGAPVDAEYVLCASNVELINADVAGTGVCTFLVTPSSANLLTALTTETGTGLVVFNDSPLFADDFDLVAAGVRFSAADGVLTLLGIGTGSDENLVINLDDTANTVAFSSTTGVINYSFNTLIGLNFNLGTFLTVVSPGGGLDSYLQLLVTGGGQAGIRYSLTGIGAAWETYMDSGGGYTWKIAGGATVWTLASGSTTPVYNQSIDFGAAGVRLSGADGVLTMLGLGNGNDENLTWDFDNGAANTIVVGTGTGATKIDFGTLVIEGAFSSSDGSAGVTVSACTAFKDGLCVTGT